MAGLGGAVGEHGQVAGRLREPGELQSSIATRLLAGLGRERRRIAGGEIVAHGAAAVRALHDDEAPWLAQPDGRRQAGDLDRS